MANLVFTKKNYGANGSFYEATATANDDFNIHIECEKPGTIEVFISTVQNGAYAHAFTYNSAEAFDHDFECSVYPKYIKIQSQQQPTTAIITENE